MHRQEEQLSCKLGRASPFINLHKLGTSSPNLALVRQWRSQDRARIIITGQTILTSPKRPCFCLVSLWLPIVWSKTWPTLRNNKRRRRSRAKLLTTKQLTKKSKRSRRRNNHFIQIRSRFLVYCWKEKQQRRRSMLSAPRWMSNR